MSSSASPCSGPRDGTGRLPAAIREKVRNHPCYSESAHHHFARMHVPVAPACNIQCHYCNRKFDCCNESRPGVVSQLLKPEQAVEKVAVVAARIPELAVVGIAGPGDPLANPRRTLATCRMVRDRFPQLRLCLSTNGLRVLEHVEAIRELGIDHVTITINAIDAEIGAQIHPWIFTDHRRIHGVAGAQLLIERQLAAVAALAERGVLVKINSVLIPEINAEHLPQVSRAVHQRGAFLHNIMPLIAEPEHGTHFGLTGERVPTTAELQAVQTQCAGDMAQMRHCRQCRADAIGFLGDDASEASESSAAESSAGALAGSATGSAGDVYAMLAAGQRRTEALRQAEAAALEAVAATPASTPTPTPTSAKAATAALEE
ncbi:nitrogenase cofactor biosynthesis protein NifB [Halorhodospira abdelmalekii]|uniref:nitrogenase cofactor biosynthesis protein NifB n=1 Tax=Halorhodospira abdelmalekii TaxID=421629 RepID=UPI0019074348|nr:nitrogenase cofactor biosynthesis protein NifB [Halorhodospira abdelmalekii]